MDRENLCRWNVLSCTLKEENNGIQRGSYMSGIIECLCFIEFIKRVGKRD